MDWDFVFDAYPVNRKLIWLNNCGITPAGTHIVQAISIFLEGYTERGILTQTASYSGTKRRIKEILAGLLGCQPNELALIHNTAEGMNFISQGLSLKPTDEIILLENEYPSNIYPWRHWGKKGVKIFSTPMEASPTAFTRALRQMVTDKTRVISLSAVHWCTGMPLPIDQIGMLCRERRIDFVVDGAQGVGIQRIDLKKTNIDYMAFPAWKWLMGPLGLGVLYVSESKLDSLQPTFVGPDSVVHSESYLPYKSELKPGADRFSFSTASINDLVHFQAALEFLESIGFERVRKRLFKLSEHLVKGLRQIGFHVLADEFPEHPSGIVVGENPRISSDLIFSHLKKNDIVAAKRLGSIRFSPHIYISHEQIDKVIRTLSQI